MEQTDLFQPVKEPYRSAQNLEYLKIYKEAIKFSLAGSSVKILPTGIKDGTDKSDSEKMFWRVQWTGTAIRVHTKRGEGIQSSKYYS